MHLKKCSKCKQQLPIVTFSKDSSIKSGHRSSCRPCDKAFYSANMLHKRAISRRSYHKNLLRQRERWLLKQYGISLDSYDLMYLKQKGKCAICDKEESILQVDHDHDISSVDNVSIIRQLLCGNCNKGIGLFKDSSALLLKAVDYLKSWGK